MWFVYGMLVVFSLLLATALFFFIVTRGALLLRSRSSRPAGPAAHVYPIYSNMFLIRLVDFQPVISAILLFQYNRLVARIVAGLVASDLRGQTVLVTSCPFGNVVPKVVDAAFKAHAGRVLMIDLVRNELLNVERKLGQPAGQVDYQVDDATALSLADGAVGANVMFFLLHELPHPMKLAALAEAGRVLAPGGKLYLGEFHRPDWRVLRLLSWAYFTVFESLGLALWDSHDPVACLDAMGGWSCQRTTMFFGNFQIITATRLAPAALAPV